MQTCDKSRSAATAAFRLQRLAGLLEPACSPGGGPILDLEETAADAAAALTLVGADAHGVGGLAPDAAGANAGALATDAGSALGFYGVSGWW